MIRQNDPRRWKERADGAMIYEDHGAPANLYPDVINKKIEHNDARLDKSKMPAMETEMEVSFFAAIGRRR